MIIALGLILTVLTFLPTVARTIGRVSPDFSLIIIIFLTFRAGLPLASLAAFLLGCFQNSLTISPEGLESLSMLLVAIIVSFGTEFMKISNFFLLLLVVLAVLIKNTIFIPGFLSIMGIYQGVSSVIFIDCLVKSIFTGVIAVPVLATLVILSGSDEKKNNGR